MRTAIAIIAIMFACAKYLVLLGFNQQLIFDNQKEIKLDIKNLEKKFSDEAEDYAKLKLIAEQNQLKPTQKDGFTWLPHTIISN